MKVNLDDMGDRQRVVLTKDQLIGWLHATGFDVELNGELIGTYRGKEADYPRVIEVEDVLD